jgi:uncharacterized phiE125 gp8 family phage protein
MTVLEQCISSQPIKVSSTVGLQVPMYSCAPGKSVLAHLPPQELDAFFAGVKLKQYTPTTLATRSALLDDLAKTRKKGFSTDIAEGLEGIHCVAAAVLDEYRYPVAAVTVMSPSFRLKRDQFEKFGHLCMQAAETITGRQIVTARWKLVLDAFPGPSLMGVPAGRPFTLPGHAILIPKAPVQSIVSIDYLDMGSVQRTMPSANYVADLACEPARITPVFGQIWPITLPQIGAVSVTFDAGWGNAASVPEGIKRWILLRVGSLYQNREEVAAMARGTIQSLPFIDGLLDPYRMVMA